MRIAAVHAFYRTRGGEDVSHSSETQTLREAGHQVVEISTQNTDDNPKSVVASILGADHTLSEWIGRELESSHVDVAYLNNLHPKLQFPVLDELERLRIPFVRVLRNYRVSCLSGLMFRDGKVCTDCVGSSAVRGVLHRCSDGSFGKSAVLGFSDALQKRRNHWNSSLGVYIAVSSSVRDVALTAGVDPGRIYLRPNLLSPEPSRSEVKGAESRSGFLFVGRGTREKGVYFLLEAFKDSGVPDQLTIIGDMSHLKPSLPNGVRSMGVLNHEVAMREIAKAKCVVVPSLWNEPFGRVVIEALAVGTPVIATKAGGLSDLVGEGVAGVHPHDVAGLAAELRRISRMDNVELQRTINICTNRYREQFPKRKWIEQTESILERALELR